MSFYLGKNMLIQLLKKLRPELQRSESSSPACCVTRTQENTPLSQRIKQKRERDNFKELSKRVGFGHFSSQMHDCEKENAS